MGNPKPRFVHITDPCHQLETHSGGILNIKFNDGSSSRVEMLSMWPLPWIHGPTNQRRKRTPNLTKLCTQANVDSGASNRLKIDGRSARGVSSDRNPHRPTCGTSQTDLGPLQPTLGSSISRRCTKSVHPSIDRHPSRSVDDSDLPTDLLSSLQVPPLQEPTLGGYKNSGVELHL
jgi:hypothetical protein